MIRYLSQISVSKHPIKNKCLYIYSLWNALKAITMKSSYITHQQYHCWFGPLLNSFPIAFLQLESLNFIIYKNLEQCIVNTDRFLVNMSATS